LGFTDEERTKTFYLEGIKAGSTYADQQIKVEFDPDGDEGAAGWDVEDAVRITVVSVDADIDSDNDGTVDDTDDPIENKTPGCIIPKNLEGDGEGEDCLESLSLSVAPTLPESTAILSGDSGIRVWTTIAKTTEVTLPHTYDPASTMPSTLYVDGETAGTSADLQITYKDKNDLEIGSDSLKALVTETPSWAPAKQNIAYVWSSLHTNANSNIGNNLGWGDGDAFEDQLTDQDWDVIWFNDTTGDTDTDFGSCTLANYKKMKDCGALTVICHGETEACIAVYADTEPAATSWRGTESDMTTEYWPAIPADPYWTDDIYVVKVDSAWHASNWAGTLNTNKAIAMWSICYSAADSGGSSLKEAAGGRWRSGYRWPTTETEAEQTNNRFLGRLNGSVDSGNRRTAGEAWEDGNGYTYAHSYAHVDPLNVRMDGNDWTTLNAAPDKNHPHFPDDNPSKRYGWGCVIFDTYMRDATSAATALVKKSGGCSTYDHRWVGNTYGKFAIGFDYDTTDGTATTMQAKRQDCTNYDALWGRPLDEDREAPIEDDHEWSF